MVIGHGRSVFHQFGEQPRGGFGWARSRVDSIRRMHVSSSGLMELACTENPLA